LDILSIKKLFLVVFGLGKLNLTLHSRHVKRLFSSITAVNNLGKEGGRDLVSSINTFFGFSFDLVVVDSGDEADLNIRVIKEVVVDMLLDGFSNLFGGRLLLDESGRFADGACFASIAAYFSLSLGSKGSNSPSFSASIAASALSPSSVMLERRL
jgi:hypothetical protein